MYRLLLDIGAQRKRLRRQLTWVRKFTKVFSGLDRMYRLLLDIGGAIDLSRSDGVLETKCLEVLPMRLLATLWAGACGATAQDLRKMLVGQLLDAKRMIGDLLASREQRIEQLFGLALGPIHEALNPHFQFDVLHPDLPAAFSVFIHRG